MQKLPESFCWPSALPKRPAVERSREVDGIDDGVGLPSRKLALSRLELTGRLVGRSVIFHNLVSQTEQSDGIESAKCVGLPRNDHEHPKQLWPI